MHIEPSERGLLCAVRGAHIQTSTHTIHTPAHTHTHTRTHTRAHLYLNGFQQSLAEIKIIRHLHVEASERSLLCAVRGAPVAHDEALESHNALQVHVECLIVLTRVGVVDKIVYNAFEEEEKKSKY